MELLIHPRRLAISPHSARDAATAAMIDRSATSALSETIHTEQIRLFATGLCCNVEFAKITYALQTAQLQLSFTRLKRVSTYVENTSLQGERFKHVFTKTYFGRMALRKKLILRCSFKSV